MAQNPYQTNQQGGYYVPPTPQGGAFIPAGNTMVNTTAFNIPNYNLHNQQLQGGIQNAQNRQENNQFLQGQGDLVKMLQNQAAGNGPSPAQLQMKQALDSSLSQQYALAASQGGGVNPGAAFRNIMQNQAGNVQNIAAQTGQMRAQEQLSAQQQLGSVLGQARGQSQQYQQMNDQLVQFYTNAGLTLDQAQANAQMSMQQLISNNQNKQVEDQLQAQKNAIAQQQANQSLWDSIFSDERLKTNIQPVGYSDERLKTDVRPLLSSGINMKTDVTPVTVPAPQQSLTQSTNDRAQAMFDQLQSQASQNMKQGQSPLKGTIRSGLTQGAQQGLNKLGDVAQSSGYDTLGSGLHTASNMIQNPVGTVGNIGSNLFSTSQPLSNASQSIVSGLGSQAPTSVSTMGSGLTEGLGTGGGTSLLNTAAGALTPGAGEAGAQGASTLLSQGQGFGTGLFGDLAPATIPGVSNAVSGPGLGALTGAAGAAGQGGTAVGEGAITGAVSSALPMAAGEGASALSGGLVGGGEAAASGLAEGGATAIGGISELLPALGLLVSDENQKENKKPKKKDKISSMLDELTPYEYNYKEPEKDGQGKHFGVMAQDLEKSKAGSTMVVDTPRGKAIDLKKGFSAMLAAHAVLNDRLRAVEDQLKKRSK